MVEMQKTVRHRSRPRVQTGDSALVAERNRGRIPDVCLMQAEYSASVQKGQPYGVKIKVASGPELDQLYAVIGDPRGKIGITAIENVRTKLADDRRRNARVAVVRANFIRWP
jgi:hypothetical protein